MKINEWISKLVQKELESREVLEAEIIEEHEVKLLPAPKGIDLYV